MELAVPEGSSATKFYSREASKLCGRSYCPIGRSFSALQASQAPMVHWSNRFSLRTLLIATTLIATLLATAAYLRLW